MLLAQVSELQVANTSRMRIKDRPRYFSQLGEARQCLKRGDLDGAKVIIASARRLLGGSTNAVTRAWSLGTALGLGIAAAAVMSWRYLAGSCSHGGCEAPSLAIFCMGMGTLGASCSLVFRASTLVAEPGAGKIVLWLEATARVLSGTLSGFLLYLVTRSNLVFSAAAIQSAPFAGHLLFAFASGYVERFIPSVAESLQTFGSEPPVPSPTEVDDGKRRAESAKTDN